MKGRLAMLVCCALHSAGAPVLAGTEDSVVRVIASPTLPDPVRPWAKVNANEGGGTGVIIDGNRILTNAHVVLYSPEVHVQARPGDEKFEAKVQALDRDIDLALLTVNDESFFGKKPPLRRADRLPRVQDPVTVFGFPIGGNDLSVTKGVISRIESKVYGNRGFGTVIQISAAVNPGNSGGPAVVADKLVGLVQSHAAGTQNISYIIPNEEIEVFLDDLKSGRYHGKAIDATRTTYGDSENPAIRRMLKVDPAVKGVVVQPPRHPGPNYPLKAFDIVTRIGEHDLDNSGKVRLPDGQRSYFLHLVARLAKNDRVPLTVWRAGKLIKVELPVTRRDDRLMPYYTGEPLAYFIHGPLVFAAARADDIGRYYQMNRNLYSDNSPLVSRRYDYVQFPGEELVVVSAPMFRHKIAKGYSDPVAKVVEKVNGVKIKNLKHLVETLRDCTEEFVSFHFADDWSEVLVFSRQELEEATTDILEDHGIAATRRGSPELLKLWKARTANQP
jgi:S1-C subfamily serine protease